MKTSAFIFMAKLTLGLRREMRGQTAFCITNWQKCAWEFTKT